MINDHLPDRIWLSQNCFGIMKDWALRTINKNVGFLKFWSLSGHDKKLSILRTTRGEGWREFWEWLLIKKLCSGARGEWRGGLVSQNK